MYEGDSYIFEGAFRVKVLVTDVPAPEHLILFLNYGKVISAKGRSALHCFGSLRIPMMPIYEAFN